MSLLGREGEKRDFAEMRRDMVAVQLRMRGIRDAGVLDAMLKIPREEFVPEELRFRAYDDSPVGIGEGQTISQPYMVAIMTAVLKLKKTDRVLEIGTGSGYQAAVLAECAREVITIERIPSLQYHAKEVLSKLGYKNIIFAVADGTLGYPALAPYDGIIVTAGAPRVPEPLKEQLADGGRLVIPVGDRTFQQCLLVVKRDKEFDEQNLTGCMFVPLIGKEGWQN
jgi:protein-L-isoaspartate(D-aspartate) O-methyltransferase